MPSLNAAVWQFSVQKNVHNIVLCYVHGTYWFCDFSLTLSIKNIVLKCLVTYWILFALVFVLQKPHLTRYIWFEQNENSCK